jgi:hypothetical protein
VLLVDLATFRAGVIAVTVARCRFVSHFRIWLKSASNVTWN